MGAKSIRHTQCGFSRCRPQTCGNHLLSTQLHPSMALRYERLGSLKRGLMGGVSVVSFSPDGTYIATAGLKDVKLYVWRVADQKLLHTYTGANGAWLSITWLLGRSNTLLCGSDTGHICELTFDTVRRCSLNFCLLHVWLHSSRKSPRYVDVGHTTIPSNMWQSKMNN